MHSSAVFGKFIIALVSLCCVSTWAQEATIRKNLAARSPQFQEIDSVAKTPIAGLYEVRVNGSEIFYTDAKGDYYLQGNLIDAKRMKNVTKERLDDLVMVKFKDLPLKDSFAITRGNGERKVAIFEDPNCGYCKRLEREIKSLNNVTIHVFLYPVLGKDSIAKSRAILCSKDPALAWTDWMEKGQLSVSEASNCDTATLTRNLVFGQKYKIEGTPTMILQNGKRVAGTIETAMLEKLLSEVQ